MHYDVARPPSQGKDVYIVDIGGNYVRHIVEGRMNVHTCAPMIDLRDSSRETERLERVRILAQEGVVRRDVARDVCNGDTRLRCRKLGQECKIKADMGLMFHSTYDMTWDVVKDCMDAHELKMLWCVVHYDVRVFYQEKFTIDGLNCLVTVKDGKIKFTFGNDSSLSYVHDYDTYMRFLVETVVVTPRGRCYLIERMHEIDGTLFIRMTYCEVRPMSLQVDVSFSYWNRLSNKIVVSS